MFTHELVAEKPYVIIDLMGKKNKKWKKSAVFLMKVIYVLYVSLLGVILQSRNQEKDYMHCFDTDSSCS